MKNADMPAMPSTTWDNEFDKVAEQSDGLTKREHFAAMAMQGLVVKDEFCIEDETVEIMASWSVKCADALLKELEKK